MLRPSRTLSLIRALMLPAAVVTGAAAVATTVVGCKDESQPEYWVDKLDDRAWKPRAVKRLEQFFEDAFTRANKDLTSPDVKALADKTLEPLVNTYMNDYADLDEKTRVSLIKLIAAFRDPRAEPALKKAFEEFGKRGKGAEDVKWAARAAGEMKMPALSEPMVASFDQLRASTMEGGRVYRDLNDAMLKNPSPAWSGILKKKLEPEITPPQNAKEKSQVDKFRDELFWQTTSAQLLGEIKDESAIEPLLKVMLDPSKADVQATAVLALVKIGKPAADRTIKILKDQDPAMASYAAARTQRASGAKEPPKDKPHIQVAALILGVMGRQDTLPQMIEALKTTKDETTKSIIAREIAKIPSTPASKQAFKEAFEGISLDANIPPGVNALQQLVESAGQFYDSSFVPWLLERPEAVKGGGDEMKLLQSTVTVTAIKLMKPDQIGVVDAAVKRWGTQVEKDSMKQGRDLLTACGDRVSCYLAAMEKSEHQEKDKQFIALKAGYMVGIYGDEKARDELIAGLESVENAAVRFTAAQTIDYLSPKGSKDAADLLQRIIDTNAKSADKDKMMGDAPLKQVMYRVRARAE